MRARFCLKPLAAAIALICAGSAAAAAPSADELARMVRQLNQRMEKLEQRNAALEQELRASRTQAAQAPAAAPIEQRLQQLEAQQARISQSLEADTLGENEPELTARLKAVEMQTRNMQGVARKISGLEGITAGLSLTTVAQKPYGVAGQNSQLNYRGDAFVSLPLAPIGDIEHKVFAQFRLGQGGGLNGLPLFSRPNATAFRLDSLRPDDAVALLAQAWYQADIPLPFGGYKPQSKQTLQLNFGKMDPFVFFDQNAAAGDETRQFMNAVFVHNPLLDAGGDIGVDANGFTPGLRLSYANVTSKPETWRFSMGVFGAGKSGANYERTLSKPMVMVQAETEQRLFGGLAGNYRIYAWRNAQASHFDANIVAPERHNGWGLSADQRLGDGITLFGRYGQQMQGHVRFDRALTLGAEVNGSYWNRGGDSLGLAAGLLRSSQDYRNATAFSGNERVAELYYRYRINKQFELSPNLQYIGNPAGDGSADAIKILGLRAQINY
jgi:high affinity Mn2+ porin